MSQDSDQEMGASSGSSVRYVHARKVDADDVEEQRPLVGADRDKDKDNNPLTALMPAVFYISTSASLILLNKYALASFGFLCPNALLVFHCVLAVVLVKVAELLGYVQLEPLSWQIVRLWFPVNLIFVGMIVTSFYALTLIGVGMFTLLKNSIANIFTISGDYIVNRKTYGWKVWACLVLMVLSSIIGGLTDLRFSLPGYIWQFINCAFTSAYSLYLIGVMDKVVPLTTTKKRLNEFSMVYYNNLLSIGPLVLIMAWFGEFQRLPSEEALRSPAFLFVAFLGGLLGFAISFTSLFFMSRTTATIYSLTGSLNKTLVAVAGIIIFHEPTTLTNLGSISLGLAAGTLFVLAKIDKRK